jgi:hypothetical protein
MRITFQRVDLAVRLQRRRLLEDHLRELHDRGVGDGVEVAARHRRLDRPRQLARAAEPLGHLPLLERLLPAAGAGARAGEAVRLQPLEDLVDAAILLARERFELIQLVAGAILRP